jgi:3-oxoacyl-[acyl-carrier protein] reductase
METNRESFYIVCGASSGFGRAVVHHLLKQGHRVLAIARKQEKLQNLKKDNPDQVDILTGDLTEHATLDEIKGLVTDHFLDGVFINSGGPPAKTIEETTMEDWDTAYYSLFRWKIELTKMLLPQFKHQQYGRILFLESASVKQPIENLVLSTSLRLGVVGYAKTLSEEVASNGITVNVLAPGYHDTDALKRLFAKKAENENISENEARKKFIEKTKVGFIGDPLDLGAIAAWLLSEESRYITGQTISVDGGVIKGVFG